MYILLIIFSYLLGSISFGYLIAKMLKGVDIRKIGSGNTGATNISRLMGFKYAILVLILDALKGLLAILISSYLGFETWVVLLCGLAVIIGHNWPAFFAFRGGRGAATTLGVFLGLAPVPTLVVFGLFIVIILTSRYVSLGTIVAAVLIPFTMFLLNYPLNYFVFGLSVCIILLWRHYPNIIRLLQGRESKLGDKVKIP
ncbi:MAG TPA: glycerol-3-phosphate 1-O-acyltransferase PlsY [Firmicutes bacterium]|nr:glycerol-3-phosphate 1-O-acyltransferase PlsY [Bacillota bacterium]